MTIRRSDEGELYTPPGHDAAVVSRKLFNPKTGCPKVDVHVTSFAPGTGMDEEVHEFSDHVIYMLSGSLEVLQSGRAIGVLNAGDAIHIPAGERHLVRNPGTVPGVFIVTTTLMK